MLRPRLRDDTTELADGFERIRVELEVPDAFDDSVRAALAGLRADASEDRVDRRDLELVSMDPVGSRDLDQAFHLERVGSGYRFSYAIADVAAWVTAGGPIDAEARRRGTTVYCPDRRVPLHPFELSEGAASLLPGEDRPALLWSIDLDQSGERTGAELSRTTVRNRRALDYQGAQDHLDGGGTDEQIRLLEEIGTRRLEREEARGGVSLNLPEQAVVKDGDHYTLRYDTTLDTERWNAQLSLCAGMAAADLMLAAGFGILRTLPPAGPGVIESLRAASRSLEVAWPDGTSYPDWVRSLDPSVPRHLALLHAAARTLRGAAYAAFDGPPPPLAEHSAIAAPYAHVTAPLRRLVDRFANECVLAACAHRRPPGWVIDAMAELPATMESTGRRASGVDHACVDLVEAVILESRVGDEFDATVTEVRHDGAAVVQIVDPAVVGVVRPAPPEAGVHVRVRVDATDPLRRTTTFSLVG